MIGDNVIIADSPGDVRSNIAAITGRDQNGNSAHPTYRSGFATQAQPVEHINRIDHLREAIALARKAHAGREFKTYCPQHEFNNENSNPSLGVTVNSRGKLRAVCRSRSCAGVEDRLKELGLLRVVWSRVASYEYRERGTLVYTVHREQDGNGSKRFRQQKADGSWNVKGVEPLFYSLDELTAAPKEKLRIALEGERDCDNARYDGYLATTISGGAKGRLPSEARFKQVANGSLVVVISDNDAPGPDGKPGPGQQHAARMARVFLRVGNRVKVVWKLPRDAKDYTEFREQGGTVEELNALIESTPEAALDTLPAEVAARDGCYESYEEALDEMNSRRGAYEDSFYDLTTRKAISPQRLDQTCTVHYRNEKGVFVPAAPRWRTDARHRTLTGVVWKPGEPGITSMGELNLFTSLPGDPAKADGSPFLQLYFALRDHVLRDPLERAYFEWLIAYRLTHLAAKIPIAIILVGLQGAGKSLLLTLIGLLLFGRYLSAPTAKQMSREFNAVWAKEKLVALFEEGISGDDAASKASFKNLVSQVTVIANAKFQTETEMPDYLMFWFTTNYFESISLDRDDRRAFVVKCAGVLDACVPGLSAWILTVLFPERAETVEEKEFWRHERERASHELARYFMSIDLKQFGITAPAMMTPAKRELLRKQRSHLDELADEFVAEAKQRQVDADESALAEGREIAPQPSNLFMFARSLLKVDPDGRGKSNQVAWRRALERAGAVQLLDERGEERQVRLQLYDCSGSTPRPFRATYRPLAAINADYWGNAASSLLVTAVEWSLIACGELKEMTVANKRRLARHEPKY